MDRLRLYYRIKHELSGDEGKEIIARARAHQETRYSPYGDGISGEPGGSSWRGASSRQVRMEARLRRGTDGERASIRRARLHLEHVPPSDPQRRQSPPSCPARSARLRRGLPWSLVIHPTPRSALGRDAGALCTAAFDGRPEETRGSATRMAF